VDFKKIISQIRKESQDTFNANHRILSFNEFLRELCKDPYKFSRPSAQYIVDMFDFYGTRNVDIVGTGIRRFKVFDAPFRNTDGRIIAQEETENDIYATIRAFADSGKADKLILLHGPNGSSKTSIIDMIFQGLEFYSSQPEGALYRFNWIFSDVAEGRKEAIGFVKQEKDSEDMESFAHIDEKLITCKLGCAMKDNPVFLIPKKYREMIFAGFEAGQLGEHKQKILTQYIVEGELCQNCKQIFESLLTGYRGDWLKVMRHIQVERMFLSKRYRTGCVTIEPQANIDAAARHVLFERNISLPPMLQGCTFVQPMGDLISANVGMVEYSDFFKRPLETNKYLLTTAERETISLPDFMAYLDVVMIATSNEKNLTVFKTHPDFNAFKGRMEFIRTPYILQYTRERLIYTDHLTAISRTKHIAPHTDMLTSLWAVLTRLKKPNPAKFSPALAELVKKLSPVEKAKLYNHNEAPHYLSPKEAKLLAGAVKLLKEEHDESVEEFEGMPMLAYEGSLGASPREMKTVLSDACANQKFKCLTPQALFEQLEELVRLKTVYDFLRIDPEDGYYDAPKFIDDIRAEYLKVINEEINDAADLVEEKEYDRLFEQYFKHIRAFDTKTKVVNPSTGREENPDEKFMAEIEKQIGTTKPAEVVRKNLITEIAAYTIENPGKKIDFREIFADLFSQLKDSFYKERKKKIEVIAANMLTYGTKEFKKLPKTVQRPATNALSKLRRKYNYCNECAKEMVSFFLKYQD